MRLQTLLTLTVAAIAASACAVTAEVSSEGSAPIVAVDPVAPGAAGACLAGADDCLDNPGLPTDDSADEQARLVEAQPGMDNVRAVGWDRAQVDLDDQAVTVYWWSGVEPCNVLDHVEVAYTEDAVTVTLYEGSQPSDEDVACIEIAERRMYRIQLDEPVGPRSLLDGSEG